ncbi:MAG: hypothetical protein FD138_4750 [Planctomycetota bacterium]|nr:MAG: hypothetical protein FD138_4750 [Planctomycetota bacterium]
MKRATSATACSNDAPALRTRSAADVNRWVAMIDAELRSEKDEVEPTEESVTVSLEFGREQSLAANWSSSTVNSASALSSC